MGHSGGRHYRHRGDCEERKGIRKDKVSVHDCNKGTSYVIRRGTHMAHFAALEMERVPKKKKSGPLRIA